MVKGDKVGALKGLALSSHSFSRTFAEMPNENETRAPNHHFASIVIIVILNVPSIYLSNEGNALLRVRTKLRTKETRVLSNITSIASKTEQF